MSLGNDGILLADLEMEIEAFTFRDPGFLLFLRLLQQVLEVIQYLLVHVLA